MIASDRASLPEVAGDAALYAAPEDIEGMAEALVALAEDETRRAAMREKGLAQAAKFSWTACARETLAVYRSVL